ncbi:MAG: septum formation initiator family protein [Candidatus Margulisiibacteriota bacterium]
MARVKVKNWYNFLLNPGVIVTLLLFFYFVFLIRSDLVQYFGLVGERKYLEDKLVEAELQNRRYLKELARLDQDSYIEEQARLRLGLIRKDEVGYMVY